MIMIEPNGYTHNTALPHNVREKKRNNVNCFQTKITQK